MDGTFGRGGHSRELLRRLGPEAHLVVFDKDPLAIAAARDLAAGDGRVSVVHGGFASVGEELAAMGIARIDGAAAAAQLWIVHGGVAAIYKLAYDERFGALSIGSLLTAHMMQHVIDIDGVQEVDYLMGDDAYKRDWMSQRRERWGLVAFNPYSVDGLTGLLRHELGRLRRCAASWCATGLRHGKKSQWWRGFLTKDDRRK